MLLYLSQEGRGIGLLNKLRAYKLQEEGLDTVDANLKLGLPADLRDYGIGAQILVDLGLTQRSASSPTTRRRSVGLEGYGLSVTEQVPIQSRAQPAQRGLPATPSATSMGHTLHHQGLPLDEEMIHEEHERRRARDGRRRRRAGVSDEEREALAAASSRSASRRFYEDLAERLVERRAEGVRRARRQRGVGPHVYEVPGRLRAAARREALRRDRAASPASPASAS